MNVKSASVSPEYLAIVDSENGSPRINRYQGGPLGIDAWLAMFNPGEFFRDINSTFKMFRDSQMEHKETEMDVNSRTSLGN
jgi:hypothetical protein